MVTAPKTVDCSQFLRNACLSSLSNYELLVQGIILSTVNVKCFDLLMQFFFSLHFKLLLEARFLNEKSFSDRSSYSLFIEFIIIFQVYCDPLTNMRSVRNHEPLQWYDIIDFGHKLSWFCF